MCVCIWAILHEGLNGEHYASKYSALYVIGEVLGLLLRIEGLDSETSVPRPSIHQPQHLRSGCPYCKRPEGCLQVGILHLGLGF